jgi:hypothetical protein
MSFRPRVALALFTTLAVLTPGLGRAAAPNVPAPSPHPTSTYDAL